MSAAVTVIADEQQLPEERNLDAYAGDTFRIEVDLFDSADAPHDLTGSAVVATIRDDQGADSPLACTVDADPTTGRLYLAGPLGAGVYRYDVQETAGARVTTWLHGELAVEGDLTTA